MSGAISVHHGAFGRAALYKLDKPIITHAHREAHLIFHIDGGDGSVKVGDRTVALNSNSAAAVSPWESHSFDVDNPKKPLYTLTLYIKPMWFLENIKSSEFALSFGNPAIAITKPVGEWVTRLTSLLMEQEGSERFDGFLYETTRHCYEQSWDGVDVDRSQRETDRCYLDFRVRRSLKLMQERFYDDIEIDWLARESGLSRPHFFKLFKRQMGITPNLYLNTLRAEQAIKELMVTSKSVTDIGYDLGFSSQASFTRFFTSNVGIPPSDYRRVAHIA